MDTVMTVCLSHIALSRLLFPRKTKFLCMHFRQTNKHHHHRLKPWPSLRGVGLNNTMPTSIKTQLTRSSADADNRLDAFSGQSRSTNMVPFHMLHVVSYCAIVTLSLRYSSSKKFHDLEMGVKGHSRSLKVVPFRRSSMVSY